MSSTPLPAGGKLKDQAVDLGFCADIDAGGGLIEDEHGSAGLDRPGEQHLLLIAAAQSFHWPALRAAGPDVELLHDPRDGRVELAPLDQAGPAGQARNG
jgi:hypothetical protein